LQAGVETAALQRVFNWADQSANVYKKKDRQP
jgi:hypothetical protein